MGMELRVAAGGPHKVTLHCGCIRDPTPAAENLLQTYPTLHILGSVFYQCDAKHTSH